MNQGDDRNQLRIRNKFTVQPDLLEVDRAAIAMSIWGKIYKWWEQGIRKVPAKTPVKPPDAIKSS